MLNTAPLDDIVLRSTINLLVLELFYCINDPNCHADRKTRRYCNRNKFKDLEDDFLYGNYLRKDECQYCISDNGKEEDED